MKRLCLLLALMMLLSLAGCCYEPGTEGLRGMDSWYQRIPTLPGGEDGELDADSTESTEATVAEDEMVAIPDPDIDLDAMPARLDSDFVRVIDYIPDAVVELKYSTMDNFTGSRVYDFSDVYLRYGTVVKLMEIQKELRKQGMLMKIWDGFRPTNTQYTLWAAKPDPNFVSNPAVGFSNHSRGNTVDITLVNARGEELEMPSGYDDFTALADRDYSDCTEEASVNALILEELMTRYGFVGYSGEWWHYADSTEYPVEKIFDPSVVSLWYAECNQYINLRTQPNAASEAIDQIPKDHTFTLLGFVDEYFAYVEYKGQRGYVNAGYIRPL